MVDSELVTAGFMGITAGIPAGFMFLRHIAPIAVSISRAVTALERIAGSLETVTMQLDKLDRCLNRLEDFTYEREVAK